MQALILVDLQNDFLPGGALAVPRGDEVLPLANRLQQRFPLIVATQDWHPRNHESFITQHPGNKIGDRIMLHGLEQIVWPEHCVQRTQGAEFASSLCRDKIDAVFQKGTDPALDSYSGFFDNARRKATGLGDYLRERGVQEVYIMGLATDYCVKYTALDAVSLGFRTFLILDACRGVELHPGDVERAVEEMRKTGVRIIRSDELLAGTTG